MADTCFINRDGKVIGKASPDTVKKHIASGKILPTDQIGNSPTGPWRRVGAVPALAKLIERKPTADVSNQLDDEYGIPSPIRRQKKTPEVTTQLTEKEAENRGLSILRQFNWRMWLSLSFFSCLLGHFIFEDVFIGRTNWAIQHTSLVVKLERYYVGSGSFPVFHIGFVLFYVTLWVMVCLDIISRYRR